MRSLWKYSLGLVVAAIFFSTMASSASALQFVFGPGGEFSGSGGTLSGQVVVTISEIAGDDDSVKVTIDTTGLAPDDDPDSEPNEKITGLWLNYSGDLSKLMVEDTADSLLDATDFTISESDLAVLKPDGDGFFDIFADYPTSGSVLGPGLTDMFTLKVTMGTLDPEDFNVGSEPSGGGGPGPFTAALRAQGLNEDGNSGHFAPIPEPSTISLLGLGLISLAGYSWRRHKHRG